MYRIYSYKLSNLSQISREVDANINYKCVLGISRFQSIHDDELNAKITRWYYYCLRVTINLCYVLRYDFKIGVHCFSSSFYGHFYVTSNLVCTFYMGNNS